MKIPKELKIYLNEYCTTCGKKLILKGKTFYGYSSNTGEKEYLYKIGCSKKSIFFNHTNKKFLCCRDYMCRKKVNIILEQI